MTLVIVSGFEPLAYRLGGGRSIQLSYANIKHDKDYITKHVCIVYKRECGRSPLSFFVENCSHFVGEFSNKAR